MLQVRKESPVSLATQDCLGQTDARDFPDHQVWLKAGTNTPSEVIHRDEVRVLTCCFCFGAGAKGDPGFPGSPGGPGPLGLKGSMGEMGLPGRLKSTCRCFTSPGLKILTLHSDDAQDR